VIIIGTKTKLKRPSLRPIDLDSTPSKSILKKESSYPFIEQPVRNPIFKSQWLQSTVSKLAVISGPAVPTAYTADQPSMFRKLVAQATAVTQVTPGSPSTTQGSWTSRLCQQRATTFTGIPRQLVLPSFFQVIETCEVLCGTIDDGACFLR
jgi:hypothetical protein